MVEKTALVSVETMTDLTSSLSSMTKMFFTKSYIPRTMPISEVCLEKRKNSILWLDLTFFEAKCTVWHGEKPSLRTACLLCGHGKGIGWTTAGTPRRSQEVSITGCRGRCGIGNGFGRR